MTQLIGMSHRDRPRVVVADDDAEARSMLAFMLELSGFDVVLAADGGDALQVVRIHGADVLVSDMNMPILDGLELCREVRALPNFDSLPIILWSNVEPDEGRLVEAVGLPNVTFVSKAAVVTKLDAAIRAALPSRSTAAQLDSRPEAATPISAGERADLEMGGAAS